MPGPDAAALIELPARIDLVATLAPLAHGRGDPTIRFGPDGVWRATRTPEGAAALHLRASSDRLQVEAWGPGAGWAVSNAGALAGADDDPSALVPHHALIADLARRFPGLRLPRSGRPFEALLPAICEQKVTGVEARAAFRRMVLRYGEPAPGPPEARLRLPPLPSFLAGLPYFAFHPLGLERRRAEVVQRAARLAPRLEAATPGQARSAMEDVPGIGPWTIAEVARVAWGDPDAVSVGDFHMPNLVAWALAREPRADDARMLELLEPYRGQRGRVQRLLEVSGIRAPRYGPRMAPRRIAEM